MVAVVGASGLGASYFLIHIYVTPLKRFLQAMFALGTIGGLYLMTSQVCIQSSSTLGLLCMAGMCFSPARRQGRLWHSCSHQ